MRLSLHSLLIALCILVLFIAVAGTLVFQSSPGSLTRADVLGEAPHATSSATTTFERAQESDDDGGAVCRLTMTSTTTAFVTGSTIHLTRGATSSSQRHILLIDETLHEWAKGDESGMRRELTSSAYTQPVQRTGTSSATQTTEAAHDPFDESVNSRAAITRFVEENLSRCVPASISNALQTPPPVLFDDEEESGTDTVFQATEQQKTATESPQRPEEESEATTSTSTLEE